MTAEPRAKRAIAFIDGQNLFYAAKKAFGYSYPNYEPQLLAKCVAIQQGWTLVRTRFYTGLPDPRDNAAWNHFWVKKLAALGTRGVDTYSRHLRYQTEMVRLPGGGIYTARVAHEKGIDIRIALDTVRLARKNQYDVGLIFSQDQDLSEAVDEVRAIAHEQNRWIKLACAFPVGPGTTNRRGINGTDWIRISQADYDGCIDPADYRKM